MKKNNKTKNRKGLKIGIGVLAVAILIFFALIEFFTNYLWFKELGYTSVFFKQLFTQLKIGIPTFIIVTFITYIYFKLLKKSYYKKVESKSPDRSKSVNIISWGLAGLFGFIVTYFSVTRLWFNALKFANSESFNMKDPIFNTDVSFYVFKLEFISDLNSLLIGLLVVFIILTLIYYSILMGSRTPNLFEEASTSDPFNESDRFSESDPYSTGDSNANKGFDLNSILEKLGINIGNKNGQSNQNKKSSAPKQLDKDNLKHLFSIAATQLIVVGVIFFLMVGLHFFLKQYSLLYANTSAVYGAGYTDVHVTLWMYRILVGLSLLGAVGVIMGVKRKKFAPLIAIPILMIVVSLLGTGASSLVQRVIVAPDEIAKESKYLERNIEFTKYAYGLNNVTVKPFSAKAALTQQDIIDNEPTISNIRINDYLPAKKFYNQTQAIRQYYVFKDVNVDRYMVNGEYTQTFLSAREIDETEINDSWLNRHIKYTHGYGITLSQVDRVTASGQPEMLIDSIPPESDAKGIEVTRPEIYFGQETNDYILVDTKEDEFDYPDGDTNKETRYEGSAGIKLNPLNKIMFSVREKSLKLLVSSNLDSNSKIMFNRNIEDRVKTIMPYLDYDSTPYMITDNGKLYWIIDAYTTSDKMPYSEPVEAGDQTNYIRNSVKVVIDAYNGDTNYYIVDKDDPIAATYKNIYPKLFKEIESMPEGIRAHIRYPHTLMEKQAKIFERYHVEDVRVFWQGEDRWQIANETYGTEVQPMTPNYYIMELPGEKEAEFVSSIPFTPKAKKNMSGLLLTRNDGEHYGEMVLFKLPKGKIVYGPMQIEGRIDQSTEISKEFSLWDSAGSNYSRGNMFILPINDSLLYVEPVYLEAKNASIPEVKRVIVAYEDKIAYEATLAEALDSLFGEGSGDGYAIDNKGGTQDKPSKNLSKSELAKKANQAYEEAIKAQKEGDWKTYGEKLEELKDYLNKLQ